MNKNIFIINGVGAGGKDTFIDFVKMYIHTTGHSARNCDSIYQIKEMAKENGWDGEKDAKGRLLLESLKKAFVAYNDMPFEYCKKEMQEFMVSDEEAIMFIHSREPDEIQRLKDTGNDLLHIPTYSLLVEGREEGNNETPTIVGNIYKVYYNYIIKNNGTKEELCEKAMGFVDKILGGK